MRLELELELRGSSLTLGEALDAHHPGGLETGDFVEVPVSIMASTPRPTVAPSASSADDPVSVTPRRRTPQAPVNSNSRKQYRLSKRTPLQTLHNRKKKKKV